MTSLPGVPAGRHFFRDDDGYEPARRATVWNQRVPDRYRRHRCRRADDVVATVRYAKATGKRVSITSGGHSWAANHLRDGAVCLDVSRLDQTGGRSGPHGRRRRPGQGRRPAQRTDRRRTVLPGRTLQGRPDRGIPPAGRIWLEQPEFMVPRARA